jgi:cell division protease FtsH
VHTKDVPLGDDVDLEAVAGKTIGFSGADLANLVNEAAMLAARERNDRVSMAMLDQARDKIMLGAEREDMLSDEEKKVVAYHEAGHALMAHLLAHADPPDKVSIVPRGRALGATEQQPEEERFNLNASYLRDRIGVLLGGRIAEKIVFGEVTTGAENDLKQATQLARRMVEQWGMSEELGPVAYKSNESHPFLGRELAQPRDYSEHTARVIDDAVRGLVTELEEHAEETLARHRDRLEALARALLEHETIAGEEIRELLEEREPEPENEAT